ncbi:hypothetical protein GPJ56_008030 [Histomonas meleagridis]|uniref:uncharacterized protein n=1 Tax=Histomonas meleagridis TaxID=135588 RepID=UPI00355A8446|nr:hypothetical protein GPJ56_008030 [Histomonas meleagridis]KAH0804902.1 hypothetical protein GO595_002295 [Histomonas meleagridis]
MLYKGNEVRGAAYGDLPFHLNIISSFAVGCNNKRNGLYNITSSFYGHERLVYPMIPNFFTAVLMSTGSGSLRISLFLPSALIILSLLFGMYSLSLKFTGNHFASALSIVIFANLGGLGWTRLFNPEHGYGDWIHNWGRNRYEYWFHPIFHILVPQRASLWSMPLCYWGILFLIHSVERFDWRFFLLSALYTGFTPLVQVHSYVSLAQYAIFLCILTFPWTHKSKMPKVIALWALYAIVANVMAFPQLIPYVKRASGGEFLKLAPLWITRRVGALQMWWNGLGVFFAIAVFFGFAVLDKTQIIQYLPSLMIFITTNIIQYQPWELDNTKVFYAGWIPIALPVVSLYLATLLRIRKTKIIGVILLLSSIASAAIHSFDCLSSDPHIFESADINLGLWIAENTPVDAMFYTTNWHTNTVATIGGRQLFLGYLGWVSSHGINYYERERVFHMLKTNPNDVDAFKKYDISYVVSEKNEFSVIENNFDGNLWSKVYQDPKYLVLRLRETPIELEFDAPSR